MDDLPLAALCPQKRELSAHMWKRLTQAMEHCCAEGWNASLDPPRFLLRSARSIGIKRGRLMALFPGVKFPKSLYCSGNRSSGAGKRGRPCKMTDADICKELTKMSSSVGWSCRHEAPKRHLTTTKKCCKGDRDFEANSGQAPAARPPQLLPSQEAKWPVQLLFWMGPKRSRSPRAHHQGPHSLKQNLCNLK
eukprot:3483598-Lingulodinium_polyedra.AAC.1